MSKQEEIPSPEKKVNILDPILDLNFTPTKFPKKIKVA